MRKSGFYWCLRGYLWDVMYFTGGDTGEWWAPMEQTAYTDDDVDEIDERRIVRDEARP